MTKTELKKLLIIMSKQEVVFLRGAPASGKSFIAKAMTTLKEGNYKRVNRDEIREQLDFYSTVGDFASEKTVSEVEHQNIMTLLGKGYNVIIDCTLTEISYLRKYFSLFFNTGMNLNFRLIKANATLEECKENNKKRELAGGRFVPEKVIEKMHKKIASNHTAMEMAFNKLVESYNYNFSIKNKYHIAKHSDKKGVFICDLDGTAAKMNGRSPYDWHKVHEDTLNEPLDLVLEALAKSYSGLEMIFLSGREDVCYDATLKWLHSHNLKVDALLMRKSRDMRPDWEVKLEILENEIIAKGKIPILSFDDRDSICRLWRHLGIPCYQVDFGNF